MKIHLSLIVSLLLSFIPIQAIAADEIVEKTECVQAFSYKDLDELKADLLLQAKRAAVDDLFGFLIVSSTAVQQSVLTEDAVSSSSVGYVRVKGIPDYNHGDSLAEVCITVQAYVTDKDRSKFDPVTITADECVTEPDLSPRKLEDFGEEQTILKALATMNSKLKDKDRDSLLKLVRNVSFSKDSKIIPNTDTYCGSVTAEVVPIEVEAFLASAATQNALDDSADTQYSFSEEFATAELDESDWDIFGPPITLDKDWVTFNSKLTQFPFIVPRQALFAAEKSFELEIAFRYPNTTSYGVGFSLDTLIPPYGYSDPNGVPRSTPPVLTVWGSSTLGIQIKVLGNEIVNLPGSNNLPHVINVQYSKTGTYRIHFDGSVIYQSVEGTPNPTVIWFGNYVSVPRASEWTSLQIDYVRLREYQSSK